MIANALFSLLIDLVDINPPRRIKKGLICPFVSMDALDPFRRQIREVKKREFKGSGVRFQNGDTLLARITPCLENGKTTYVDFLDENTFAFGSTEFIVLCGKKGISDNLFVYYFSRSEEFRSRAIALMEGTSGRQRVPAPALSDLKAHFPPLPEQKAIAHILGSLDDKIELNRKMNETLEAITRAIFKSWFVDFDPVRAKAEGHRPVGMNAETAALFPDSFEDSELGLIPKGWKIETIKNVSERVAMGPFGSSIKVSTFVPDGIPVISGQHLNHTLLQDNKYNFITYEHANRLKNSNVFRGDIIFTHAGNIGQVAYIPETSRYSRYIISQRQFYMRCDLTRISPLYIVYFFKMPIGQHKLLANRSSTGVPSITQPVSYLKSIQLPIPIKEVSDAFERAIRPKHLQISKNIIQSETLALIRDTLLPKLLSGEIRIKDAERFVEDVT